MLMICRMSNFEEVLIVEDENGNIACDTRKIMMSLSSIYKGTLPGGQELAVKNILGTAEHGLHQLQNEVLLLTTFHQVSKAVVALGCWTASGTILGKCCVMDDGWALASWTAAGALASWTAVGHLRPCRRLGHLLRRQRLDGVRDGGCATGFVYGGWAPWGPWFVDALPSSTANGKREACGVWSRRCGGVDDRSWRRWR